MSFILTIQAFYLIRVVDDTYQVDIRRYQGDTQPCNPTGLLGYPMVHIRPIRRIEGYQGYQGYQGLSGVIRP